MVFIPAGLPETDPSVHKPRTILLDFREWNDVASSDSTETTITRDTLGEIIMKQNVGGIDRILRLVVGVALLTWGYLDQNWWGAVGIIPLFTGTTSWCLLYQPFGLSTKKG